MIVLLTAASGPVLAQAFALLGELRHQHPDLPRRLLLADRAIAGLGQGTAAGLAKTDILAAEALGVDQLSSLAFALERQAFTCALLPHAIARCFEDPACEAVIFLDAAASLHRPLTPLLEALAGGADAVLLPREPRPGCPEATPETDMALLRLGLYDPGCLAIRNSVDGQRLVAWWQHATDRAVDGGDPGFFLSGRWLDLVPAYCERTQLLRHPGLGVTPANAAQRGLHRTAAGWQLQQEALLLARFPDGALATGEVGAGLIEAWKRRIAKAAEEVAPQPYAFDYTTGGIPIPSLLRRYFATVLAGTVADPFTPTADWFSRPAVGLALQPQEHFSRFAQFLHDDDPGRVPQVDLRQPQARAFLVDWLRRDGLADLGLPQPLHQFALRGLNALPVGLDDSALLMPSPRFRMSDASVGERLVGAVWRLRTAYRILPPGLRRAVRDLLLRLTRTRHSTLVGDGTLFTSLAPATAQAKPDPKLPDGAVLLGYPEAELGIGQAMRGLAQGMLEVGVPLRLSNFANHIVSHQQRDHSLSHLIDHNATAKAQILCINADQLPAGLGEIGHQRVAAAYNIAYPFWELPRLPQHWVPNFAGIDEVWAPSRFVQQSLEAALDLPVTHIGVAVRLTPPQPLRRANFGIPDDCFAFLFFFDYTSYASRKNPEAVVEAFQRAFPPDDPAPVALVLKSVGRELEAGRRAQLTALVARDPRIRLIDRALEPGAQSALLGLVDALVSLHRSEGFGLGLAEALLLGKAVVATGYGGCMDFLTADNACLVDYRLVPVGPGQYPHGEGQFWAEPDIDQAAHHLRRLVADPGFAQQLGARGQADILTHHSPAVVGRRAAARLRALRLIG